MTHARRQSEDEILDYDEPQRLKPAAGYESASGMTQTRREEENEKIAEIARKCQENGASTSDLLFMCGWLAACVKGYHRREDAIRALPRLAQDQNCEVGLHMVESETGGYFDEDDVLRIIDDWDEKP